MCNNVETTCNFDFKKLIWKIIKFINRRQKRNREFEARRLISREILSSERVRERERERVLQSEKEEQTDRRVSERLFETNSDRQTSTVNITWYYRWNNSIHVRIGPTSVLMKWCRIGQSGINSARDGLRDPLF